MSLRGKVNHPDFPHGKTTGYQYGCRKECCREPQRAAMAEYRAVKAGRPGWPTKKKPPSVHGTRSRYNKGCHCRRCRDANTAYMLLWHKGLTLRDPSLGLP